MDFDSKRNEVNIGSDDTVIINKLYGPTIFCNLRITARTSDCKWVIERQVIEQDAQGNDISYYETMLEIDGQASIDFREED